MALRVAEETTVQLVCWAAADHSLAHRKQVEPHRTQPGPRLASRTRSAPWLQQLGSDCCSCGFNLESQAHPTAARSFTDASSRHRAPVFRHCLLCSAFKSCDSNVRIRFKMEGAGCHLSQALDMGCSSIVPPLGFKCVKEFDRCPIRKRLERFDRSGSYCCLLPTRVASRLAYSS